MGSCTRCCKPAVSCQAPATWHGQGQAAHLISAFVRVCEAARGQDGTQLGLEAGWRVPAGTQPALQQGSSFVARSCWCALAAAGLGTRAPPRPTTKSSACCARSQTAACNHWTAEGPSSRQLPLRPAQPAAHLGESSVRGTLLLPRCAVASASKRRAEPALPLPAARERSRCSSISSLYSCTSTRRPASSAMSCSTEGLHERVPSSACVSLLTAELA